MMNIHTAASRFEIDQEVFGAERAVIARCLAEPSLIPEVSAKVAPTDFQHPFLGAFFKSLVDIHDEGRKPSVETLVSLYGAQEVEGGLSVRDFLTRLMRASLYGQFVPVDDAIEVIVDTSRRSQLAKIGGDLASCHVSPKSIVEIASDAALRIDDLIASCRAGEPQTYDGKAIGEAIISHLGSEGPINPTTGIHDLDAVLGGWPKGELSVLAARPGMGKSAVATSALLRAAKARHGCLFFSLEMTAQQIGARMLTDLAFTADDPIYYEAILQRKPIDDRKMRRLAEARDIIKNLPILIEVERGLSITDLSVRARKVAAQFVRAGASLDVIYVDHMLLVRASQRYAGNRVREVAEISDGLASLAKELHVAVVALCQLNRGVEGREVKRPALADLRDSGAIEEDASTVTFIYRPAYYLEQTRAEGDAELKRQAALDACRNSLEFIVAKNRNGRVGIVDAYVEIGANVVRDKAYGG